MISYGHSVFDPNAPKKVTYNLDEMDKIPSYSFDVNGFRCWSLEHYVLIMKASKMGDAEAFNKLKQMTESQVHSGELRTIEIHGVNEELWQRIRIKVLKTGLFREISQNVEVAVYDKLKLTPNNH